MQLEMNTANFSQHILMFPELENGKKFFVSAFQSLSFVNRIKTCFFPPANKRARKILEISSRCQTMKVMTDNFQSKVPHDTFSRHT